MSISESISEPGLPPSQTNPTSTPPEAAPWFEHLIRVQPHHTDYGGVVWHGTYLTWMESARVECLRAVGYPFERLVKLGYDLPVVALDMRYRRPLTLGMTAIVKTRLEPTKGIRLNWRYEIEAGDGTANDENDGERLCLSATVTLVTVDTRDRKVVRRLPPEIKTMVTQVTEHFQPKP